MASVSCAAPVEETTPEAAPRFNVVLLSLDTLRGDHLGLYGYSRETSPNLDDLAAQSVVFDLAVAQSSHTVPSHRALFQSRLVSHASNEAPVLAETLKSAGYRTAAFTGAGKMSKELGFDRGFESFEEEFVGFSRSFPKIEAWLRSSPHQPFFLFLHTYDVHLPYNPPPPYDNMFLPDYKGPISASTAKDAIHRYMGLSEHEDMADRDQLTEEDERKIVALYDGGIRYADQYVGQLIDVLKAEDLWRNTIFVVLADHGEEFLEHNSYLHGMTLFEEVLRVPLIIHLPRGHFAGRRVAEPVALVDVKPTILDLAGVKPSHEMQGRSLTPLMRGSKVEAVPILSEIQGTKSLIRYPWKLITSARESRLYDLKTDPGEEVDVAVNHQDLVSELAAEAERMLKRKPQFAIEHVNSSDVEDEELRRQLEALGYIDG